MTKNNINYKKVFKILKEKRVNIPHFYHVVFVLRKDYESCKLNNNNFMYNICDTDKEFLTHEEFNLLIKVFSGKHCEVEE